MMLFPSRYLVYSSSKSIFQPLQGHIVLVKKHIDYVAKSCFRQQELHSTSVEASCERAETTTCPLAVLHFSYGTQPMAYDDSHLSVMKHIIALPMLFL